MIKFKKTKDLLMLSGLLLLNVMLLYNVVALISTHVWSIVIPLTEIIFWIALTFIIVALAYLIIDLYKELQIYINKKKENE